MTVTVEVQVVLFEEASAAVSVTVFAPTVAQVKLFTSIVVLLIAQLSLEPLSTSPAVIVALPLASR